jgi:hypothetical protein
MRTRYWGRQEVRWQYPEEEGVFADALDGLDEECVEGETARSRILRTFLKYNNKNKIMTMRETPNQTRGRRGNDQGWWVWWRTSRNLAKGLFFFSRRSMVLMQFS